MEQLFIAVGNHTVPPAACKVQFTHKVPFVLPLRLKWPHERILNWDLTGDVWEHDAPCWRRRRTTTVQQFFNCSIHNYLINVVILYLFN